MPEIGNKPFDREYHRIQMELVGLLQRQISWADKVEIVNTMSRIRLDYDNLERERQIHADSSMTREKPDSHSS